jgi:hypothetical protein
MLVVNSYIPIRQFGISAIDSPEHLCYTDTTDTPTVVYATSLLNNLNLKTSRPLLGHRLTLIDADLGRTELRCSAFICVLDIGDITTLAVQTFLPANPPLQCTSPLL